MKDTKAKADHAKNSNTVKFCFILKLKDKKSSINLDHLHVYSLQLLFVET